MWVPQMLNKEEFEEYNRLVTMSVPPGGSSVVLTKEVWGRDKTRYYLKVYGAEGGPIHGAYREVLRGYREPLLILATLFHDMRVAGVLPYRKLYLISDVIDPIQDYCRGRVLTEEGVEIGMHCSTSIGWLRSDLRSKIENIGEWEIVDLIGQEVPERFRLR